MIKYNLHFLKKDSIILNDYIYILILFIFKYFKLHILHIYISICKSEWPLGHEKNEIPRGLALVDEVFGETNNIITITQ